jgi:class 3 adenylate cyclase
LAEKILSSKSALEGERKQVTVLFAELKGSMELLSDRDPEEARQLLDPVLERMMDAVHRYEGTVNQVMGDGIMALFETPLAHFWGEQRKFRHHVLDALRRPPEDGVARRSLRKHPASPCHCRQGRRGDDPPSPTELQQPRWPRKPSPALT